jgi:hydrogenase maturation protease
MEEPRVLVLGIGNVLLGDEAAGIRAVRALAARDPPPAGAVFIDGGTLGFALAGEVAAHPGLVVMDAADLGRPPGSVELLRGERMDEFLGGGRWHSVHEAGLLDLLAVTRLEGLLPAERALLAIQPGRIEWSETLSPAVAAGVERACGLATELIRDMRGALARSARGDQHASESTDRR